MENSGIRIGLPCVYEQLCFWIGVAFAVFIVGLIAIMIISVWRDKATQQKKRQQHRKRSAKK